MRVVKLISISFRNGLTYHYITVNIFLYFIYLSFPTKPPN